MAIGKATPEAFKFTSTPVSDAQRDAYFAKALGDAERGSAYPFAVVQQPSGEIIGTTRLTYILWEHRNCELGYTWFAPKYQGTGANAESKYLLLGYAFETLELLRVQLRTDVRNLQSQAAIKLLGAVYEGTLRKHMIVKEGFVRDSMVFSIVDTEWPQVKAGLEARIQKKLGAAREDKAPPAR
jgi:RimJ/RimL family protein N-acetyltransferase